MTNAGERNKRITIEQKSVTKDSYGAETVTWVTLTTVSAAIVTTGGGEFYAAQKLSAEVTALIKIQYLSTVASTMRIKFGSRYFDILFVNNINQRNEETHLSCREVV